MFWRSSLASSPKPAIDRYSMRMTVCAICNLCLCNIVTHSMSPASTHSPNGKQSSLMFETNFSCLNIATFRFQVTSTTKALRSYRKRCCLDRPNNFRLESPLNDAAILPLTQCAILSFLDIVCASLTDISLEYLKVCV